MRMYNKLIWEDDFDGSELDMTKWSFRTGNWQVAPDGTPSCLAGATRSCSTIPTAAET